MNLDAAARRGLTRFARLTRRTSLPPARLAFGAALLGALLAASGCGRTGPLPLLPPEDVLARYGRERARVREEVHDFEASGKMLISRGGLTVQAEDRYLFRSPNRARLHVRYGGILGFGRWEYDLLLRADSVYVAVQPDGWSWGGTPEEFGTLWGEDGRLLVAAMPEVAPGGFDDCRGPLQAVERLPDGEIPDGRVGGACPAGAFRRFVWIDPRRLLPEECRFYDRGNRLVGKARYDKFERVGEITQPSRIEIAFPGESMSVTVEHDVQRVNRGLDDALFEPSPEGGEG